MRTLAQKQNKPQKQVSSSFARSNTAILGPHHHANPLLHLQRTIGNQAAQQMLRPHTEELEVGSTSTAASRFAHDFSRIPVHAPAAGMVQAKLTVNTAGDVYEQEADRVAEQVMRMKGSNLSLAAAPSHVVPQRFGESRMLERPWQRSEEERQGELEENESGPDTKDVNDRVASEIRTLHGSGSPLPKSPRAFFESRFGHDFTAVRIHSDFRAATLARSVNARAFTLGQEIVFGSGQYSPETGAGTRLLAHELAHVVQQQTSRATIQRQPAKGGWVLPPPPHTKFDDVRDQIRIIHETQVPYEILKDPKYIKIRDSDVDVLESMLSNRKLSAIVKLGNLGDESAVSTLIALVEDRVFAVKSLALHRKLMLQQAALDALGQIGGPAALSKLNALLNSKDPKDKLMAARGFSSATGGQAVTDLLTALKKETDADVKAQIISALGKVGSSLSSNQEKELIVKEVIREMENNTGAVKLAAINALGRIKLKSATEALLKQLKLWLSIEDTAQEIVRVLGEIGDDKAVDMVVIMLEKHGSKKVRSEAAMALKKIGVPKALAALKSRLAQETDPDVKAVIENALR